MSIEEISKIEPVELPYGTSVFRKESRELANAFNRALNSSMKFQVSEPVTKATNADVVNKLDELLVAIDRMCAFVVLPAIHTSDEASSVGFTAREQQKVWIEEGRMKAPGRKASREIAGLEGSGESANEAPSTNGSDDIPF